MASRIITITFLCAFIFLSCDQKVKKAKGLFQFNMLLTKTDTLNFLIDIKENEVVLINGIEKIKLDSVQRIKDSIIFKLPVFDTEFHLKSGNDSLIGYWQDFSRGNNYRIEVIGEKINKIDTPNANADDVSGKWKVDFNLGTGDYYPAIGVFRQENNNINGTFLTPSGDYRYINGTVNHRKLKLHSFNGSHAFLFKAELDNEGELSNGIFYSGIHSLETWTASRNETFQLPDSDTITLLNPGINMFHFEFPNQNGNMVSSDDDRYKNKVVIVQIMGTWCPNCMDETIFLSEYYRNMKRKGLEVIALAFERHKTIEQVKTNISNFKKEFNIDYEILIAGTDNKNDASKKLPMLNHVISFPTTIFINKDGIVKRIHTGFSGPATGKEFLKIKNDFHSTVEKLLEGK